MNNGMIGAAVAGFAIAAIAIATYQHAQPWYGCIDRAGYVYVVDSRTCVPFGALVPAREVKP